MVTVRIARENVSKYCELNDFVTTEINTDIDCIQKHYLNIHTRFNTFLDI